MDYWYIGSFPPPYGGVTKKNLMIFESMKSYIKINRICENGKFAMVKQLIRLLNRKTSFIIGVGGMKTLETVILIMWRFNREALKKTVVLVPGGVFHNYVSTASATYRKALQQTKVMLVETDGMKESLNRIGFLNVDVFPNCRDNIPFFSPKKNNGQLRFVFFSMISNHKGIDLFLEAAGRFPSIQFDIYGELNFSNDDEFKDFSKKCNLHENVSYYGCCKGTDTEIFDLLNKYDALILPSRWKFEGVPGVLVESKIAAIPAIVSSINFNSEIVINGKEGIVLKENNLEELVQAIKQLDSDRDYLFQLSIGAKESAERYQFENYREMFFNYLK